MQASKKVTKGGGVTIQEVSVRRPAFFREFRLTLQRMKTASTFRSMFRLVSIAERWMM